jgi:hypothetical protein
MHMKSLTTILAAGTLLLGASLSDASQFYIDVSGGNGSPFSLTFANDITFTATADADGTSAAILIQGLTNATSTEAASGSGLSLSVNGASNIYALNMQVSGQNYNDTRKDDLLLFSSYDIHYAGTIQTGDIVVLNAGTYTSSSNVSYSLNGSGYYTLELDNSSNHIISSTAAISVPEPAEYASVIGLAAFGALFLRRRAKK